MRRTELSQAEARRTALAAQGFAAPRPARAVTARDIGRLFGRIGAVQIDSVNVLARSHYLPAFSRLGPYRAGLLDDAAYGRRRTLFEYWAHAASFLPLDVFPLMRWRMNEATRYTNIYRGIAAFARRKRRFLDSVLREVERRGPVTAGELEPGGGKGSWWGWSDTKRALEFLFWAGAVTTATRRGFERVYDLTERVIPVEILARPVPEADAAQRALLLIAMRALGVATERDLRDYFRLAVADARRRIVELVEAGDLLTVRVEGWKQPAYVPAALTIPRRVAARALLSPFDSLIWERDRTARLFGFDYRLEIYTPAHKRVHGYYVLPFLAGDRLVARADLKADRAAGVLRVHAVHFEDGADRGAVMAALGPELAAMAGWLGLGDVALPAPRRNVRAKAG
jgi:uncharacterized protein YcaQ